MDLEAYYVGRTPEEIREHYEVEESYDEEYDDLSFLEDDYAEEKDNGKS